MADEVVWIVEFQSGRCGTCRDFAPIWKKLVDAVGGKARFGVVDIDEAAGMALAKDIDALEDGIPSVRMLRAPGDRYECASLSDRPFTLSAFHQQRLYHRPPDLGGRRLW